MGPHFHLQFALLSEVTLKAAKPLHNATLVTHAIPFMPTSPNRKP